MKHLLTARAAAILAAWSLTAAAQNAPKPPPKAARGAASAASAPAGPAAAAAAASASGSPAVQAAERARMPGDLGPDKPTTPQIVVPLRGRAAAAPAASATAAAAAPGGIDDGAARCAALKSKARRQACQAAPAGSAPRR